MSRVRQATEPYGRGESANEPGNQGWLGNWSGCLRQPIYGLPDYAARSRRVELCSIDTGMVLVLSPLPLIRIRGLVASLRRARRNTSMKKIPAPQRLAIASASITPKINAI